MRDRRDNVVIICSIENFDAMGVHTGDSITVAPAQTLTDKEYQRMRDAAIACIREIGVETGGSNIQFALNPANGRMVVIEMNRASRARRRWPRRPPASDREDRGQARGGYTLDEIPNDITRLTPASFEPSIDYCVVKIPRFAFEKFPETSDTLGISMKSVGEVMAIGRTFRKRSARGSAPRDRPVRLEAPAGAARPTMEHIEAGLTRPNPGRLFLVAEAFRQNFTVERIAKLSGFDRGSSSSCA